MNRHNPKISRRDLIKGLGTLGILSGLQAETLLAQTSPTPLRVLFVALQHGWGISGTSNQVMTGTQSDFQFPAGLAPFNSIRDKCVVVDGLLSLGLWGNNHDLSYSDILTAGVPMNASSSSFDVHMPLSVTPSLDYLLQQHSGKTTFRFSAGYQSWGVRYHPLSFDDNSTVLPFYTSANAAYTNLFRNQGSSTQPKPGDPTEARLIDNIFNFIKSPAERDSNMLTGEQKGKLTRYLSAVEETQATVKPVVMESGNEVVTTIPAAGQTSMQDLPNYLEMIKVGFANNMTTSAVLGIGDIHSIDKFHHDHAHNITPTWWQTRTDFAQRITAFAQELDAITDFDGNSLLDNTLIVLTGEVADGSHDVINKGHILIGGGNRVGMGRYLKQTVLTFPANRTAIDALRREDVNGVLQRQFLWGGNHVVGTRTNADLLREIGNLAGLQLSQFGLASQNKGSVLS
jgi:Protein of unknown function (DUF1552)